MKYLVTGAYGFLGRHLTDRLVNDWADFHAPDHASLDLLDRQTTLRNFQSIKPDVVFHLAARVGGIGANQKHPGTFFHHNMLMGMNVLEAARDMSAKVVLVGTVCSYPKHTPVPFKEDDLWLGYPEETNAPYGIAKKALIVMAQAYRQEFGCNFVTALLANLYGPGDNFDLETSHVIPAMIRKFEEARVTGEKTVVLWGDGSPTREFLYVKDAVDGLMEMADKYDLPEPVNIGTGVEISIRNLAEKIQKAVGFEGEIDWDYSRPNGQPRRALNVSRAVDRLGFRAKTDLHDGIQRTIDWYRKHSQYK